MATEIAREPEVAIAMCHLTAQPRHVGNQPSGLLCSTGGDYPTRSLDNSAEAENLKNANVLVKARFNILKHKDHISVMYSRAWGHELPKIKACFPALSDLLLICVK